MSFTVPTFPLVVNIWPGTANTGDPPRVITVGNLSPGRRVNLQAGLEQPTTGTHLLLPPIVELLLPKRTDIRSTQITGASVSDVVEVPGGTGRYYVCCGVDDVGRGFANEYRLAWLMASTAASRVFGAVAGTLSSAGWPVPYP